MSRVYRRVPRAAARSTLHAACLDQAPVQISLVDADERLVYVNEEMCRATGYAPGELLGQKVSRFSPEELPPEAWAWWWESLRAGRQDLEAIQHRRDGSTYPVQLSVKLVEIEGRERALIAARDISARLGAEEELRRQQELLEQVVAMRTRELMAANTALEAENHERRLAEARLQVSEETLLATQRIAKLGSWERDLATDAGSYSQEALRILGLPPDHAGPSFEGVIGMILEEDRPGFLAASQETFHGRQGPPITYRLARPDGTIVWVLAQSDVTFDDSRPVRVRGSMLDITALKEAEERLEAARAAAEAANRAKSVFLAAVTHELRTPINAILNMTELALDGELDPRQRRYLDTARTSARSLVALVDDILDLSKIEAGRLDLDPVPFQLRTLLGEVIDTFRARVLETRVELVVDLAPDAPDTVIGDALRLRQVLVNLLGNAFKFTGRGEILLRVRAEVIDGLVMLTFAVRDTGIGIAPDALARLFKPFVQADSSTTRRYGGTGLGLAISQRLVELMGGAIEVDSTPGVGTEFRFTARLAPGACACEEAGPPAELVGLRALVVDDVRWSREVLARHLGRLGMHVEACGSAEDALARLPGSRVPDVVILDRVLPGMDGVAAARRLRQDPATRAVPIVMVSAFGLELPEHVRVAAGIGAVLAKPVCPGALGEAILQVRGMALRSSTPTPAPASLTDVRGARVLVAEDNEANRFVIGELLNLAGVAADFANDGEEAVARVTMAPEAYTAVLMDVQMPVLDGLAATRRIRELRAGRALPIIALTANALKQDVAACREAGMDDYVAKPIRREALFATLGRWLRAARIGEAPVEVAPKAAEEVPEVPGMDLRAAVRRVGLPWPMFGMFLDQFCASESGTVVALGEAVRAADRPRSRLLAHSLVGSAGAVGAERLAEKARALELAVAQGGDLEPYLEIVRAEAEAVFRTIEGLRAA